MGIQVTTESVADIEKQRAEAESKRPPRGRGGNRSGGRQGREGGNSNRKGAGAGNKQRNSSGKSASARRGGGGRNR